MYTVSLYWDIARLPYSATHDCITDCTLLPTRCAHQSARIHELRSYLPTPRTSGEQQDGEREDDDDRGPQVTRTVSVEEGEARRWDGRAQCAQIPRRRWPVADESCARSQGCQIAGSARTWTSRCVRHRQAWASTISVPSRRLPHLGEHLPANGLRASFSARIFVDARPSPTPR